MNLHPARLAVGDGGHNPDTGAPIPPSSAATDLTHRLSDVALASVTRTGQRVSVIGIIPGGAAPLLISEFGVLTSDGVLIALGTFSPQTIADGVDAQFALELFPEA
ncbi:hypothetical protein [Deinococcus sp. PEB2-67]